MALGGYAVLLLLCLTGFSGSLALLCVPGVVVFACNGMLSVLTTLFLSNSVDYGQLKTGRREESVIFSMQTFVVKAASGVAVFLTGIGLDLIGLVGNTEETGPVAAQSAGTLLGLRLMMTVLPMAVLAAALVLFRRRFTLTDDRAAEISAALHRRKLKMAEMQWYAATDSGRFDGTAAITPRSGAVCLRAELPAGVLQNAVAALPWTMAHEERSS